MKRSCTFGLSLVSGCLAPEAAVNPPPAAAHESSTGTADSDADATSTVTSIATDSSGARGGDGGGGGGESSDASTESSGTGGGPDNPEREPPPGFVDVTEAAGLALPVQEVPVSPHCLLDDVSSEEPNDFCWPERFTGSGAVGDYDADGHLDVFVSRRGGADRLYRSNGDGSFADVTDAVGLSADPGLGATGSAAWVDVDRDGDLDLYTTRIGETAHRLWIQTDGVFVEEAALRGAAVETESVHVGMGIGVGDYDLDGWPDLFVADWRPDKEIGDMADHNRLLHGIGDGLFEDVTDSLPLDLRGLAPIVDAKAGVYGFAPGFVDLDDDGWPELTLTADFGTSRLLWNNGGVFEDQTWERGVGTERNGMGSTFGDFDGDGDYDWFVSAIWAEAFPTLGHRLYRNDGAGNFEDVAVSFGLHDAGWGWGAAWWDYDLDADLDLVMAAGWPTLGYGIDPLAIWENVGSPPWPELASALGVDLVGDGRGVIPFDYDEDGDEDLLVLGNVGGPRLYRNDIATGHWIAVRVRGETSTTRGVGARVRVRTAPDAAWQVRPVVADTRLMGQGQTQLHFGLADHAGPVQVEVSFPASGLIRTIEDAPADAMVTVFEASPPE